MINVGVVGSAGYTGGELLRILTTHPEAEIKFVHSNSNAGNPVTQVHDDLYGLTELVFTDKLDYTSIDVLIMCVGHGDAKTFLAENPVPENVKIIDLSHDHRLVAPGNDFVYGLPELQKPKILKANKIANPGCFATCIQLGILPLAQEGYVHDEIHVTAITGSTGAGVKPSSTSHFSWRNNNMSVYKAFGHQHLGEITQSMMMLQDDMTAPINFVPFRGDFTRGIIASIYMNTDKSLEEIKEDYSFFYESDPFVHIVDTNPNLKQVVNTNNCLLYLQKYEDKLHIISVIDNLTKGASGQAVQNMNLMFGLEETTGLKLKPVGF